MNKNLTAQLRDIYVSQPRYAVSGLRTGDMGLSGGQPSKNGEKIQQSGSASSK